MNPKKVQTLHDGINVPPSEPERARQLDAYRIRRLLCRGAVLGAPLLIALLVLDFLFLPNANGRYSTVAAWRDGLVTGRTASWKNGAYCSAMGLSWPVLHVIAWQENGAWHAADTRSNRGQARQRLGVGRVTWQQGGDVFVWMSPPDTRAGLWAPASEIRPEVWAMDPMTPTFNPRTLPQPAVDAIRAAFVDVGGEVAGATFDTAPNTLTPGLTGLSQSVSATGMVHNLLSLALAVLTLACLALWIPAIRQHRRLTRGRCLRCGYELRGVTLGCCPECSLQFSRTRTYPGSPDPVAAAPGS